MRKIATIFLLLVSIGLLFGGAVSAQDPATVDVNVTDENGYNVIQADQNDEVNVDVIVLSNEETLKTPWVEIIVDPETGLQFEPAKAQMWDGTQWINNDMTNYPNQAFFFYFDPGQVWVWDIAYGYGNMGPNENTELRAPAIVTATGPITTYADLFQISAASNQAVFVDEDSYTFTAVAPTPTPTPTPVPKVCGKHVPMQETGTPLALAALGLLGIIGGGLYSRLR
jgi:hypothetical protein